MMSRLEKRVRQLDTETEPAINVAKRMAEIEANDNLSYGACYKAIFNTGRSSLVAHRQGYKSHSDYLKSLKDKNRIRLAEHGLNQYPDKPQSILYVAPHELYRIESPDKGKHRELEVAMQNILSSTLTLRERKIMIRRYFKNETLKECGKAFSLTKERIRQIEAKALEKLKLAWVEKVLAVA